MDEKTTVVLISIFFSVIMIGIFYVQHIIAPKISTQKYRLSVMVIISIINLYVLDRFDALFPLAVFGPFPTFLLFILATFLLFVGPMLQNYLQIQKIVMRVPDKEKYVKLMIKNKIKQFPIVDVIVAPIIEEFLYRYCNGNLWINAEISTLKIIFVSPLIFGLAHFHHFFETPDLKHKWKKALLRVLIQVGFTSLFGFWNQFCWVKTHGLLTCILLHAFCNYMQFPDFDEAFHWPDPKQRKKLILTYITGIVIFVVFTLLISLKY